MTYEQTMSWGAQEWSEVTERIRTEGLGRAEFTQTGGMCAAIVVGLEDGFHLLLTDAEDTLSWDRDGHQGWYVGLYAPQNEAGDGQLLVYREHPDGDTDTLIQLIRAVLREGAALVGGQRQG